jgi:ABC-2 type transport system permease protein
MLRGLWKLTWLETKIFVREPLGLIGTVGMPVVLFLLLGRVMPSRLPAAAGGQIFAVHVPVFVSIFITIGAVLSLVTIVSIYREGGILKRLRATPLRPQTILTAHVLVKLLLTAATFVAMIVAGRRYLPPDDTVPIIGFTVALLLSTITILSIGFVIASLVPTARFAQPVGSLVLYPMLAVSGLFVPIASMPPWLQATSRALPLTYAVSLLDGIWVGDRWTTHALDIAVLILWWIGATAFSAKVFRWE